MPRASSAQTVFPFGGQPEEVSPEDRKDAAVAWDQVLLDAISEHFARQPFKKEEDVLRIAEGLAKAGLSN